MAENVTIPQGFELVQDQPTIPAGFEIVEPEGFLTKAGRFAGQAAMEIPVGMGQLAVGATQLGAEILGAEDFAGRIGQQVKKEREVEGDITTAQKVGRFIGETAPLLPVGAGSGLIKGGIKAGAATGLLTPTEEGTAKERVVQIGQLGAFGGLAGGLFKGIGSTLGLGKKLLTASTPQDVLARRLKPEQAREALQALKTSEAPLTVADVAGDEVQGLTRSVAKLPKARDLIVDALEGRSEKAVERVSRELSKDISPVENYFANLDDLAKARSEVAAPLYKKAFDKNTTLDINKNRDLFDKIAPDLKDARKKFRLDDSIKDDSIIMLDAAKKSLDDKIGKAIRQGERQEARALTEIKNELVSKLDNLNPDYKKARKVFSDFASIESAQKQGLQFSKMRPQELKRFLKNLDPSEKEAFRIGARENLQKIVSSTSEGADPAKRIFGNSFKRNQIRALFENDAQYKSFAKKMRDEIKTAETKFKVLGGSRTDINQATDAQFIDEVAQGASIVGGNKAELLRATANTLKNRVAGLTQKNATQLAKILTDRKEGAEALRSIIKKEKDELQKTLMTDFIKRIRPELLTVQTLQTARERSPAE